MPFAAPNARRKQAKLQAKVVNRLADQRRGSSADRGYDSRWVKARDAHLRQHPLCRYCETSARPRVTAATLVDHFWPHKGDEGLFWDVRFWVSSCTPCHSGFKQRVEHAGPDALARVAARLGLPPLTP